MTTYSNPDDRDSISKKTDPLRRLKPLPLDSKPSEEPLPETPAVDPSVDPLQELRNTLYTEDRPQEPAKNDLFKRMTGTLSSRKGQQGRDNTESEPVFGVRTAGNAPFEPAYRSEPEADWDKSNVILQNAPQKEPNEKDTEREISKKQTDVLRGGDQTTQLHPFESKVRPLEPHEQESVWENYPQDEIDAKPVSLLEEKSSRPPSDRKRLPSGFDRQQQVSRYIEYNPKRSGGNPFQDLSTLERTLLIVLLVAVIAVLTLIAYLFFQSRQPGFSVNAPTVIEPKPTAIVSIPFPVGLRLPGGWKFNLESGVMVDGVWNPKTSEWLIDSEIRRVVAIPWNKQIEAVVNSFEAGDLIALEMSNGDAQIYRVIRIVDVAVSDTSVLYDIRPTLAIILFKNEAEQRRVVIAEPN